MAVPQSVRHGAASRWPPLLWRSTRSACRCASARWRCGCRVQQHIARVRLQKSQKGRKEKFLELIKYRGKGNTVNYLVINLCVDLFICHRRPPSETRVLRRGWPVRKMDCFYCYKWSTGAPAVAYNRKTIKMHGFNALTVFSLNDHAYCSWIWSGSDVRTIQSCGSSSSTEMAMGITDSIIVLTLIIKAS